VVAVVLQGRALGDPAQRGDGLLQFARGLQRQRVPPPRLAQHLRQRQGVGVREDLGEAVARLGGGAVLQGDLGVLQGDAQLVDDVLADAAHQVGGRAVELAREQLDHAGGGHPLVALDQGDIAVGELGERQLRLADAQLDAEVSDPVSQSLLTH
jgi:hypothetical protein